MKLWTYGEVREKLERDLDLQDEDFISRNELAGYCNEAIDAAEAEIIKINEDYFLTKLGLAMVQNQAEIELPENIYGQKIRGLIYNDGSLQFALRRIRGMMKFELLTDINQYQPQDYYRYLLINGNEGEQAKIQLAPPAKANVTAASEILTLYYIRNAKRVPLLEEYAVDKTATADATANTLTVTGHLLETGDEFMLSTTGTMPTLLSAATVYFAIVVDANTIKVATSLLNAKLGTAVDFTTAGTGILTASLATTEAIQDATVLDIPEFTSFVIQFMKVRCYEKEPDPRYDLAVAALLAHQKQMVDTLTERTPDNDNKVELDLSYYMEHN